VALTFVKLFLEVPLTCREKKKKKERKKETFLTLIGILTFGSK
jgi:hypothetical protein